VGFRTLRTYLWLRVLCITFFICFHLVVPDALAWRAVRVAEAAVAGAGGGGGRGGANGGGSGRGVGANGRGAGRGCSARLEKGRGA